MTELQEKVALVTGADRGIGRALARRLGAPGCRLVLHSNHAERLRKAVADEGLPPERGHRGARRGRPGCRGSIRRRGD